MLTSIWKYSLKITERQLLNVPRVHTLLTVQAQNAQPCLWAAVTPETVPRDVTILCFATGGPGPAVSDRYLGTVQLNGFVWHYYAEEAL